MQKRHASSTMHHPMIIGFVFAAFTMTACAAPVAFTGRRIATTPNRSEPNVATAQRAEVPFAVVANTPELDFESECADADPSADSYGYALYTPAEETASYQLATTENDCNNLQINCFRKCWRSALPAHLKHIPKHGGQHHEYCTATCRKAFMDCMKSAGLLVEFSALAIALKWLKKDGAAILGMIVVVGGIAYVVSTAGTGALVLVVL
jgi:hypothetical protein